jgi:hypothetical protein
VEILESTARIFSSGHVGEDILYFLYLDRSLIMFIYERSYNKRYSTPLFSIGGLFVVILWLVVLIVPYIIGLSSNGTVVGFKSFRFLD